MSSLRNSLHRRNHKERSQLSHRQRFGILEKHKDYVLRARDYHSKQDRIRRLRQKAADKNQDEFYFGMNKQKTEGGVHVQDRGNASLPVDMAKILKTQDENYVRTMRAAGLKKIEKLRGQLRALADLFVTNPTDEVQTEDADTGLDKEELEILKGVGILAGPSNARKRRSSQPSAKHIVFVENEEEARRYTTSRDTLMTPHSKNRDTVGVVGAVDLGWKEPERLKRGKKKEVSDKTIDGTDKNTEFERREASKTHRTRLLKELSARLHRDRMLRYTERELEMQRLLMGKGCSKKVKDVERVEEQNDEDELDARRGRGRTSTSRHEPVVYKPRVYKWRSERKR
ncbi:u3 small nucleolar RNA-associated protein 11 [Multifurca ochricompacta]|uniref:U3 small nucleolar RNA-associated protein 11 n=1 Tax=Multifurca ochricompacta TaxID=376703 RepID=A0AAD4MD67_9AGAM|nr:u3 small nucleolar RNA-associated protein 11 [Multifurca ochricompacta]